MPRKMIIRTSQGSSPLIEGAADNEEQLQELVKDNPDLLPIEEFGMTGPVMVVGRETTLPSGAVDLVALARSGELLIVEFKTGPQNTDFRSAIAQLLDYGSDTWGMSFEEFEGTVPARYFASARCLDARVRGKQSLIDAARTTWPDMTDDEADLLRDRLSRQLELGAFHYVLVAQRFTATTERTAEYMNAAMTSARFYAVELVRFAGDGLEAYESRTVLRPTPRTSTSPTSYTNETRFLEGLEDDAYGDALRELFDVCRGLGLRFEWGAMGTSIRLPNPDRSEPLSIGWVFPPGRLGWMNLADLSLGYDPASAEQTPTIRPALIRYVQALSELPGAQMVTVKLDAYRFAPDTTISLGKRIAEVLATLVQSVSTSG